MQDEPDLTLAELCERYEQQCGVKVSASAMDHTLRKMEVSRKKRTMTPNIKSDRVEALRKVYRESLGDIHEADCLFIDETGATLNLTRLYARAPTEERAYGEKPIASGQRISTIGALSVQGIETALCFEGTLNGAVFVYFLEQFLCPLLRPGQYVILDNASPHTSREYRNSSRKRAPVYFTSRPILLTIMRLNWLD